MAEKKDDDLDHGHYDLSPPKKLNRVLVKTTPDQILANPKHEAYAQLRCQGVSKAEAARRLKINEVTAWRWSSPDTNTGKLIIARMNYLARMKSEHVVLNLSLVRFELMNTAREAREAGQFKAAVDAYKVLLEEARVLDNDPVDVHG